MMNIEECIDILIERFPEKIRLLRLCSDEEGNVDVYKFMYWAVFNVLYLLLSRKDCDEVIKKYCEFIEMMQLEGDDEVRKIMRTSIMKPLEDAEFFINESLMKFYEFVSQEFKTSYQEEIEALYYG